MIASTEIVTEHDVERRSYAQHADGKLGHHEADNDTRKHTRNSEPQATPAVQRFGRVILLAR